MSENFVVSGGNRLNGEKKRIVDTDIIVDTLRGVQASRDYLRRFEAGELEGSISVVSIAELFAGKGSCDPAVAKRLESFINLFTVLSVDIEIARKAGELVRDYGLSLPDALIGATALTLGLVLVTRNVRDFQRVPSLRLEVPYR